MAAGDQQRGLYAKYDILKIETGEKVENAFVLRPDQDAFARAALKTYADACRADYPLLAQDLDRWIALWNRQGTEDKRG